MESGSRAPLAFVAGRQNCPCPEKSVSGPRIRKAAFFAAREPRSDFQPCRGDAIAPSFSLRCRSWLRIAAAVTKLKVRTYLERTARPAKVGRQRAPSSVEGHRCARCGRGGPPRRKVISVTRVCHRPLRHIFKKSVVAFLLTPV